MRQSERRRPATRAGHERSSAGRSGDQEVPGRSDGPAPGQSRPLEPRLRAEMEGSFAHSFEDVRIWPEGAPGVSPQATGADAYAVGTDIVFAEGAYQPDSGPGRLLLAHELAHVVQQLRAPAPRDDADESPPATQPWTLDGEAEADATAAAVEVLWGERAGVEVLSPVGVAPGLLDLFGWFGGGGESAESDAEPKEPESHRKMRELQERMRKQSLMSSILTNIANMKHESLRAIAGNLRG